jgi:hypothetical protein
MKKTNYYFILSLINLVFFSCGVSETSNSINLQSGDQISYNYHIRPILSDKCFACHGPDANKREAGLRLDIAESAYSALQDNKETYGIVPFHANKSEVYHRITSTNPSEMMPPPEFNLSLNSDEVLLIKKWIDQGAQYEPHWAFVAPKKSKLPEVKDKKWSKNEIDFFVLSKLEKLNLQPNEQAKKYELLKRISLDITGLPPSPEMIAAFEKDTSPQAYEKMIDKLLTNSAYGEKMAALWMDISRYSDSYGYQDDNIRTQWPYRDWVIHAFNKNLPYDKFITWQIAGDLLPNATKEQILATAFNRNHKYTEEGGVIEEEYRVEYVLDKTNTFSKGILGITMECAQCHDHKYDPISQKNYFEMYAFFNNTPEKGYEGDVSVSKPAKNPILWIENQDIIGAMNFINHADTSKIMVSVMKERDTLRETRILNRGMYDSPTELVSPITPVSILEFPNNYPKNRLGLAKWTVNPKNPLTGRVFVNLMWQEIFGRGIVKTSGDFGMQGELPSHPELLDWLAVDFIENKWDVKKLIKTILLSATYKQSSKIDSKKLKIDPENIYLARAPRLRLTAENIRDLVLTSSGMLVKKLGGPSVKPYQPEGLWEASTSGRGELAVYRQDKGENLYRRGLYTFIKLTSPPPMPVIFDGSNRDQCEVNRGRTNTPLQALVMLNDPLVIEASEKLAISLLKQKPVDEAIEQAFIRIICRKPETKELNLLRNYFFEEKKHFTQAMKLKDKEANIQALKRVNTTIFNLEEAITKI